MYAGTQEHRDQFAGATLPRSPSAVGVAPEVEEHLGLLLEAEDRQNLRKPRAHAQGLEPAFPGPRLCVDPGHSSSVSSSTAVLITIWVSSMTPLSARCCSRAAPSSSPD